MGIGTSYMTECALNPCDGGPDLPALAFRVSLDQYGDPAFAVGVTDSPKHIEHRHMGEPLNHIALKLQGDQDEIVRKWFRTSIALNVFRDPRLQDRVALRVVKGIRVGLSDRAQAKVVEGFARQR